MDSRFRGNDETEQVSVIPAKAGIQKNGTVEDLPLFIEIIPKVDVCLLFDVGVFAYLDLYLLAFRQLQKSSPTPLLRIG